MPTAGERVRYAYLEISPMAGLILSFLLLTAGGFTPPSGMCTCITEDKPLDARITEQVKKADLIFEGVVLETHDYPSAEARRLAKEESSHMRFRAHVQKLCKGGWV